MNALLVTVVAPLVGALIIPLLWRLSWAGWLNVLVSAVTLVASLNLAVIVAEHGVLANTLFRVDAFNVYLLALTAFVGLTTSIFSRPYMSHVCDSGRVSQRGMRLYHAMFQAFMFTMLLALSTDNLGVLWVSVEGATLATVLLVSLYRTPEAIEAAWKYFILCGVGIALALFGTVLLYFAAQHVIPDPEGG